jgi:hypothetical protein
MTCTEPISSTSHFYAEAWSPNLPITHITGVYAGAGAAAPYRRRAHAVRDAQVLLWEGEQLVFLVLYTDILHAHADVHMSCARACSKYYIMNHLGGTSILVLTEYIEPQPY